MDSEENFYFTTSHLVWIRVFPISQGEEAGAGQRVLRQIREKHPSESVAVGSDSIMISLGDRRCSVRLVEESDCRTFMLTAGSADVGYVAKNLERDVSDYRVQIEHILQLLPENPISEFTVFVGFAGNQNDALSLLQQYSSYLECHEKAKGITGSCLVATLERGTTRNRDCIRKDFLISPFNQTPLGPKSAISKFYQEFIHLASCTGKLASLCRANEPFLKSMPTAERDAQETIESTYSKVNIGDLEQMQVGRLKTLLGELTARFSLLSLLASAMRRDYDTAEMYASEIGNLLNQWNEKGFEGYPTNSSAEAVECETLLRPFRNFLDRADALRTQLETILDTIRTYLSIGQQEVMEKQGNILKLLTWALTLLTIVMVILGVVGTRI